MYLCTNLYECAKQYEDNLRKPLILSQQSIWTVTNLMMMIAAATTSATIIEIHITSEIHKCTLIFKPTADLSSSFQRCEG